MLRPVVPQTCRPLFRSLAREAGAVPVLGGRVRCSAPLCQCHHKPKPLLPPMGSSPQDHFRAAQGEGYQGRPLSADSLAPPSLPAQPGSSQSCHRPPCRAPKPWWGGGDPLGPPGCRKHHSPRSIYHWPHRVLFFLLLCKHPPQPHGPTLLADVWALPAALPNPVAAPRLPSPCGAMHGAMGPHWPGPSPRGPGWEGAAVGALEPRPSYLRISVIIYLLGFFEMWTCCLLFALPNAREGFRPHKWRCSWAILNSLSFVAPIYFGWWIPKYRMFPSENWRGKCLCSF